MAVYNFGIVGGRFGLILDQGAYQENLLLKEGQNKLHLEELKKSVSKELVSNKVLTADQAEASVEELFSLKVFGDLPHFLESHPLSLSAQVRSSLRDFIENNLRLLGPGHSMSLEALQSFVEILLNQPVELKKLGQGGEGAVFKLQLASSAQAAGEGGPHSPAREVQSARATNSLAIKFLLEGEYHPDHPEVVATREILRDLPSILQISCVRCLIIPDSGLKRGLVMKMGQRTLKQAISMEETLSGKLTLLLHLAHKVASLHAAHIVHRDLKPANALLMEDGEIKIIDASFAKREGETVKKNPMTLIYSSPPEAIKAPGSSEDMVVETFFDMWSLGVMQYEILTGNLPHFGSPFAFIFAMMQKKYIEIMFPQESSQALKDRMDRDFESLIEESEKENLDQAIDSLICPEINASLFEDYSAQKQAFIAAAAKSFDQITEDDLKAMQDFLDTPSDSFVSDHSELQVDLKKDIASLIIRKKIDRFPELVKINRQLLSFQAEARGDIHAYIEALSQFVATHQ